MNQTKRRAGVSIAEMCIVLAILAIVGTLVVSFSLMVSGRASAGADKLNGADDLERSQVILEAWVDRMVGLGAQFTADETGLSATVGGQTYQVALQEGALLAPLPDGQTLSCPLSATKGLRFSQMTQAQGNPLIFCTIVCSVTSASGNENLTANTFTVFSRVGETVIN